MTSKKKRVYISGPMTGYPRKNKEMFDLAETYLRTKGYEPVNPSSKPNEILDRDATEEEYLGFMKQDVYEILYKKGGVTELWLLPEWSHSKGAGFEYKVAQFFNIPIFMIPEEVFRNDKRGNQIRRGKEKLATPTVEGVRGGSQSCGIWGEEVRQL